MTKIVSYNVFSGEDNPYSDLRRPYAITEILIHNPDVIFLQEATETFVNDFLAHTDAYDIVQKRDFLSADEYQQIKSSGFIAILFRKTFTLHSSSLVYKGGWYDDGIIKVKLNIHGKIVAFYNVHLSGGSFGKPPKVVLEKRINRMIELNILNGNLLTEERYVVAGDFNSDANSSLSFDQPYSLDNGEHIFPEIIFYPSRQIENVVDVWTFLRDDEGYTEDYLRNSFRNSLKPGQNRLVRFDQMYYRNFNHLEAKEIQLIGTTLFYDKDTELYPSDHFGLYARFDIV